MKMKCYRCGETSPEPSPTREELATALQATQAELVKALAAGPGGTRYEDVDEAKAEAARANEELADAEEQVEQLRAELRRYEPSDGMMYKLSGMQGRLDEAADIFLSWGLVGHDRVLERKAAWLERHRTSIVPPQPLEPQKTILALHTVIDEARRLFDAMVAEDQAGPTPGMITSTTWAAVDAWRTKVLVQEARETVSGEVKELAVKLQQLADANARQAAELLMAQRARKGLVECNLMMARKLDRIGDIVEPMAEDYELASAVAKELQVASLDFKYPEPVHIAFRYRDQKRPDGYFDVLPGDGFAFLGAAPKWLSLQFDCGGVMGCANITYDYLRAVLADDDECPVQLTERGKEQ